MATVIPRKPADGSSGYQAHSLSARRPGALDRLQASDPTLAAVIDRYTNEFIKKIGRTKAQVLRAIKTYDIANKRCSDIASVDVIAFANQLVVKVMPQTVANYLSHLAAVFAVVEGGARGAAGIKHVVH